MKDRSLPTQAPSLAATTTTSEAPLRPKLGRAWARRWGSWSLSLGLLCACRSAPKPEGQEPAPSAQQVPAPALPEWSETPLIGQLSDCSRWHRGLILDLAARERSTESSLQFKDQAPLTWVQRSGRQLARLSSLRNRFVFFWPEATETLSASLLLRGETSERIALTIDGQRLGGVLTKLGELKVYDIQGHPFPLSAGRHELMMSLSKPKAGNPSAELAWVRLGTEDRSSSADEPIDIALVETEVSQGSDRRPAYVFRDGSSLRCPLWLGGGDTSLHTAVALWGDGPGEAELALRTREGGRKVLARVTLDHREKDAKNAPAWKEIETGPLLSGPGFVELELSAPRVRGGARLAFASPKLRSRRDAGAVAPAAKRVVVAVLSGLNQRHKLPSSAQFGFPFLNQLAREATYYPQYRATTTSVQGVVTELLSGVPPIETGVTEMQRRWPRELLHLAPRLTAEGGKLAFLSSVPFTSSEFGFEQGQELFREFSPKADISAIEPLSQGQKWLLAQQAGPKNGVLFVHLRGGHPPFDLPQEQARELPPAEYGGDLDPRRAAIQLDMIRHRARPSSRVLSDEDWLRLEAMANQALTEQSQALALLVETLRRESLWDDTLFIVMGDVGAGERPNLPYEDAPPLGEDELSVPLLIKYPGGHLAGQTLDGAAAPRDVLRTLTEILHLPVSPELKHNSVRLDQLGASELLSQRPHLATRGSSYSTRLGTFVLTGEVGKKPTLCRVDLDPRCTTDRSDSEYLPLVTLWQSTRGVLGNRQELPENTKLRPSDLSPELRDALFVYGLTTLAP